MSRYEQKRTLPQFTARSYQYAKLGPSPYESVRIALLDLAERNSFDSKVPISLDQLALEMLVLAWYPHIYFKLSFGKLDKIARELDSIAPLTSLKPTFIHPWDKQAIRDWLSTRSTGGRLLKFVPYRLIRPFFPETRGMTKDHQVNNMVAEMCNQYFPSGKPPYKFDESHTQIILNSNWAEYFKQNIVILRGWTWWQFLNYMQRCNPNVPAISSKLQPPAERASMASQTKFWIAAMSTHSVHCIYPGAPIDKKDFALDHFVPWSFVVHNQLWNLIPTTQSTNSKKSDSIPSMDYFDAFVTAQHSALLTTHQAFKESVWKEHVSCFISDLGLSNFDAILDKQRLEEAYTKSLKPLIQLAELNGFGPAWYYPSK